LNLTDVQIDELVVFMEALTSNQYVKTGTTVGAQAGGSHE